MRCAFVLHIGCFINETIQKGASSMTPYEHKVQYYETDGMGIVHHSNYIRWFE